MRVRLRVVKSWLTAIPFELFVIFVIVLLAMVILPLVVFPLLITAIPLSPHCVIVLLVATSVNVSDGVARTIADPPIFERVFEEAVTDKLVNCPAVWK